MRVLILNNLWLPSTWLMSSLSSASTGQEGFESALLPDGLIRVGGQVTSQGKA